MSDRSKILGNNITLYRKNKSLSGKELAGMANITPAMLSQIEHSRVNPSVSTLQSIADALDVPIYTLFISPDNGDDDEFLLYSKDRNESSLDVHVERLTPGRKYAIELLLTTFPPHSSSGPELRGHPGEEVAYVVDGDVIIYRPTGPVHLRAGDSIKLSPNMPHRWENVSEQTAKVIQAVTTQDM